MYSSVKFLSPRVTAGFPLPGCDEEPPPEDDDPVLPEFELLLELPQAAKPMARVTDSSAALPLVHVRVVTSISSRDCLSGAAERFGAHTGGGRAARRRLDGWQTSRRA